MRLLPALLMLLILYSPSPVSARSMVLDVNKLERNIKRDTLVSEPDIKAAVSRTAGNPDDAEFRNTSLKKGAGDFPVMCGEVNVVDHVAGAGWQRFVYTGDALLEEDSGFERAWEKHCE